MTAATRTTEPTPLCVECCEECEPAFSPEMERCQRCAEFREWFEGAALSGGCRRTGKSGRLVAATQLINRAPVGRDEMEV